MVLIKQGLKTLVKSVNNESVMPEKKYFLKAIQKSQIIRQKNPI
jgi:hypothetical protein